MKEDYFIWGAKNMSVKKNIYHAEFLFSKTPLSLWFIHLILLETFVAKNMDLQVH